MEMKQNYNIRQISNRKWYAFENEKDFNDELLEKNGKHYTKMKKTYNNEFDALLLFIKILFIF